MGGVACWFGFVVGFYVGFAFIFFRVIHLTWEVLGAAATGLLQTGVIWDCFFSFRFPQLCGADPFFAFLDAVILFDDGYLYR